MSTALVNSFMRGQASNFRNYAAQRIQGVARRRLAGLRTRVAQRVTRRRRNFVTGRTRTRSRGLRRRLAVGTRIGSSLAKCDQIDLDFAGGTKTKYQSPLLNIAKGTSLDDTQTRNRDVVNMRGVKLCINFHNIAATIYTKNKLHCHVAVISPKSLDASEIIPDTDFFRSQGEVGRRGQDWAVTLTGTDFRCLPINTDLYNVHMHNRFALAQAVSTNEDTEHLFEKYLPLSRQIRYENGTDLPEGKNMYLVMWMSFIDEPTTGPVVNNICNVSARITRFFRESYN